MDKSGQITYVNYIYANHLERHVPGRKQHGQAVVAAERRKKTMLGYQPIPVQHQQATFPSLQTNHTWELEETTTQHEEKLFPEALDASSQVISAVALNKKQKATEDNHPSVSRNKICTKDTEVTRKPPTHKYFVLELSGFRVYSDKSFS